MFNPNITQDMTALKFLFGLGQFFIAVMPREKAKNLIKMWLDGKLSEVVGTSDHPLPNPLPNLGWAIRTASINAIHEIDPRELQQAVGQQQQQGTYNWGTGPVGPSGYPQGI